MLKCFGTSDQWPVSGDGRKLNVVTISGSAILINLHRCCLQSSRSHNWIQSEKILNKRCQYVPCRCKFL